MANAFLWVGCASKVTSQPHSEASREIGMTREQIVALYGPTRNRRASPEGEIWTYNLSAGDAWIPWTSGFHPAMRILLFGDDGRVKSCRYSQ